MVWVLITGAETRDKCLSRASKALEGVSKPSNSSNKIEFSGFSRLSRQVSSRFAFCSSRLEAESSLLEWIRLNDGKTHWMKLFERLRAQCTAAQNLAPSIAINFLFFLQRKFTHLSLREMHSAAKSPRSVSVYRASVCFLALTVNQAWFNAHEHELLLPPNSTLRRFPLNVHP